MLEVTNLTVEATTATGRPRLVRDVTFSAAAGRTLAVVGESGCGKTMSCLAIMGLLPRNCRMAAGTVRLDGEDVTGDGADQRHLRRKSFSMVFQNPTQSLNPVRTIGWQLAEAVVLRSGRSWAEARRESRALLEKVGLAEADRCARSYPHQLSGGQNQRAMIAMAIAGGPRVLIADEATTALDVTTQAQILALLKSIQEQTGLAIVFVTHDLGTVAQMADDVVVMYAGRVVEAAPVHDLFATPRHPYTEGLIASVPRMDRPDLALRAIAGTLPPLHALPPGCAFADRCGRRVDACTIAPPALTTRGDRAHACHRPLNVPAAA